MKRGKIKCPKCKKGIMMKKEHVLAYGTTVQLTCDKCGHSYGRTK
jgi:hypothetical protein